MSSKKLLRLMLFIDKFKFASITIGALLLLTACGGTPKPTVDETQFATYMSNKPQELEPSIRKLFSEPKKDIVKYELQAAMDAYHAGYYELSKRYFDRVLDNLESYYADTDGATAARSLWHEEGRKDFKGESYERVMAFYYRGLLYLREGDLENARAVFKTASLQDAFAEEEQNRCDFALVVYMQAFTSRLNNDMSLYEDAMYALNILRPDFKDSLDTNFLFIADTGKSPRKVADGKGHWQLKYRRGKKFTDVKAEVSVDGGEFKRMYTMEDIFWQATSRGGRVFDKILKGKAEFRSTSESIGSTLSKASTIAMVAAPLFNASSVGNVQGAAAGLAVLGGVASIIAMNANPHADVRYWNNLPDTVHVLPMKLKKGKHNISYRYLDKNGNILPELSSSKSIEVTKKSYIDWTRSREQLSYKYKK
ncbi:hypothetical protein N9A28_03270 [Sulfurimonas sp.]|nr:hypothetical protein [Sulfurimonas sp.]